MTQCSNAVSKILFFIFCLTFDNFVQANYLNKGEEISEVDAWLEEQNLSRYRSLFKQYGILNLESCALLNLPPDVSRKNREELQKISNLLQEQLILKKWLTANKIENLYSRLLEVRIMSLDEIYHLESLEIRSLSESDLALLNEARQLLLNAKGNLKNFKLNLWNQVMEEFQNDGGRNWEIFALASFCLAGLITFAIMAQNYFSCQKKRKLLNFVSGKCLHPPNCEVFFDWLDPKTIGEVVSFTVKFYQRNGDPYPASVVNDLKVDVSEGDVSIATICQMGGESEADSNVARIKFTARRSGLYRIGVRIGGCRIRGSPFFKTFLPGPPDPNKTHLIRQSSLVVCTKGSVQCLFIEPRDKFNNVCQFHNESLALKGYEVIIRQVDSNGSVFPSFFLHRNEMKKKIHLSLEFESEGIYHAAIFLNESVIENGEFDIIVLSGTEADLVEKNFASKNQNIWYEAKLLEIQGRTLREPKQVFCYITPKEFIVKEFFWKFIPISLITFRLCPSTKFQFLGCRKKISHGPTFAIEGLNQDLRAEMASNQCKIIAATFHRFLMKNIGGSETFKDKQDFFFREIRKMYGLRHHKWIHVMVDRSKLLETSIRATKNFSVSDWGRQFIVSFFGERGMDGGGVSREWFDLLSSSLFDSRNNLFKSFSDDKQALVHPNPERPSNLTLKMYEFAGRIVGKCLFESALGGSSRQLVKARFTRSFLALIIGLKIQYKYFEKDDPDLYLSKIRYIEENDVDEMDLYFVEEEYCQSGQLTKTVELIPNGSKIRVSNKTKHYYLDSLAQYRLMIKVKAEVEHFMKGLNELVPDSLLSIFNENELELLLCGTTKYDIADFKENHIVIKFSSRFVKILEWFWAAVSNFTVEEMSRLMQFTTGCSQLPAGGFRELSPKFTLLETATFGNLPTAHTCFNQLCLPYYISYEQFEKSLLLAITEGTGEFGLI